MYVYRRAWTSTTLWQVKTSTVQHHLSCLLFLRQMFSVYWHQSCRVHRLLYVTHPQSALTPHSTTLTHLFTSHTPPSTPTPHTTRTLQNKQQWTTTPPAPLPLAVALWLHPLSVMAATRPVQTCSGWTLGFVGNARHLCWHIQCIHGMSGGNIFNMSGSNFEVGVLTCHTTSESMRSSTVPIV